MLRPVAALLAEWGCDPIVREVPYFFRKADLVGTREAENVAVEMKVSKWQKAIGQARVYQLFAHYVYITMPTRYSKRARLDALARLGIGLISVDFKKLRPIVAECRVVLAATRSSILKGKHAELIGKRVSVLGELRWHRINP